MKKRDKVLMGMVGLNITPGRKFETSTLLVVAFFVTIGDADLAARVAESITESYNVDEPIPDSILKYQIKYRWRKSEQR